MSSRAQLYYGRSDASLSERSLSRSYAQVITYEDFPVVRKSVQQSPQNTAFAPRPIRHPYSRPKVGSGQAGRHAKHLAFLNQSPSLAELNKQMRDEEAIAKLVLKTPRKDHDGYSTRESVELRKAEDIFRVYKGNRALIETLIKAQFPGKGTSTQTGDDRPAENEDALLMNPLWVKKYEDDGKSKVAVTQSAYVTRQRPVSVINHINHVTSPLYTPPVTAADRSPATRNPKAYIPRSMAPYMYGIRGRPMTTLDRFPPALKMATAPAGARRSPASGRSSVEQRTKSCEPAEPRGPPASPRNPTNSRLNSASVHPLNISTLPTHKSSPKMSGPAEGGEEGEQKPKPLPEIRTAQSALPSPTVPTIKKSKSFEGNSDCSARMRSSDQQAGGSSNNELVAEPYQPERRLSIQLGAVMVSFDVDGEEDGAAESGDINEDVLLSGYKAGGAAHDEEEDAGEESDGGGGHVSGGSGGHRSPKTHSPIGSPLRQASTERGSREDMATLLKEHQQIVDTLKRQERSLSDTETSQQPATAAAAAAAVVPN